MFLSGISDFGSPPLQELRSLPCLPSAPSSALFAQVPAFCITISHRPCAWSQDAFSMPSVGGCVNIQHPHSPSTAKPTRLVRPASHESTATRSRHEPKARICCPRRLQAPQFTFLKALSCINPCSSTTFFRRKSEHLMQSRSFSSLRWKRSLRIAQALRSERSEAGQKSRRSGAVEAHLAGRG